jgi:hypothetical protein
MDGKIIIESLKKEPERQLEICFWFEGKRYLRTCDAKDYKVRYLFEISEDEYESLSYIDRGSDEDKRIEEAFVKYYDDALEAFNDNF